MTILSFKVTVAAETARANPHEQELKLPAGILTEGHVVIPAGHKGLTGLQLFYQERQLVPANTGGYLSGDDVTIPFFANVRLVRAPFMLVARAWNTDEKHEHTFDVHVSVSVRGNPGPVRKKRRMREADITAIVGES